MFPDKLSDSFARIKRLSIVLRLNPLSAMTVNSTSGL